MTRISHAFLYGFALIALVVLMVLMGFYAPSVNAARVTVSTLTQLCQSEQGSGGEETIPGGHAACKGYILGIIDYHTLYQSVGLTPGIDFCVPEKVENSDIQNVVDAFLNANSHHGEFLASPTVSLALSQAFPCS